MLYGTDVKVILGISSLPVPTVMPNQAAPTIVADVIGVTLPNCVFIIPPTTFIVFVSFQRAEPPEGKSYNLKVKL